MSVIFWWTLVVTEHPWFLGTGGVTEDMVWVQTSFLKPNFQLPEVKVGSWKVGLRNLVWALSTRSFGLGRLVLYAMVWLDMSIPLF